MGVSERQIPVPERQVWLFQCAQAAGAKEMELSHRPHEEYPYQARVVFPGRSRCILSETESDRDRAVWQYVASIECHHAHPAVSMPVTAIEPRQGAATS